MPKRRSPNPLAGLPNQREVLSWGMYDLANQSFTLLINTMLFSIYFKEVIATTKEQGDQWWAVLSSVSLFAVVLLSPILGAMADAKRWRKEMLVGTGIGCALLTCSLAFIPSHALFWAAALYIPANILYQLGENFLASFLPDISTPRTIARISATGWAMGYVGAILLIAIVAVCMKLLDRGPTVQWSPFFILAGIWFALGMIPAFLFLHERDREVNIRGNIVTESVTRVVSTIKDVSTFRQLAMFLTAFLIYGFGVQTIVMFAGIIASDFGIVGTTLAIFVLQISIVAGIAAIVTGMFQNKIGTKNTILIFLLVWIGAALALVYLSTLNTKPQWMFWIVGVGIGVGLGGIGTASRSMVGLFTPRDRSAEFFGLWGMTYKLAGAIGVLSFGLVKATFGDTNAMILLTGFFVVGLVLMLPVSEKQGMLAKHRAERV